MPNYGNGSRSGRPGGLHAVSAVLLATSVAASTASAGPDETAAGDVVSAGPHAEEPPASGRTPIVALPHGLASSYVTDRVGNVVPAGLTTGVPSTVLDGYRRAQERTNLAQPGCRVPLDLLAAIGKVESGHARGGRVDAAGTTTQPILGPVLNGGAFAAIRDTDGGALDGDASWDRAVGPMQFIPSTWANWASDGNDDGRASPHNIYDASLAASRYLCASDRDLGTTQGLDAAILSYNNSTGYLHLVRSWMSVYRNGFRTFPDRAGVGDGDPRPAQVAVAPVPAAQAPAVRTRPAPPPVPSGPGAPVTPPGPNPTRPGEPSPCVARGLVETTVGLVGALLAPQPGAKSSCDQQGTDSSAH